MFAFLKGSSNLIYIAFRAMWNKILPPFQNDWWIVDARLKMMWSIIHTITTGTSTILPKIARWESTNHSGTEGVLFFRNIKIINEEKAPRILWKSPKEKGQESNYNKNKYHCGIYRKSKKQRKSYCLPIPYMLQESVKATKKEQVL